MADFRARTVDGFEWFFTTDYDLEVLTSVLARDGHVVVNAHRYDNGKQTVPKKTALYRQAIVAVTVG